MLLLGTAGWCPRLDEPILLFGRSCLLKVIGLPGCLFLVKSCPLVVLGDQLFQLLSCCCVRCKSITVAQTTLLRLAGVVEDRGGSGLLLLRRTRLWDALEGSLGLRLWGSPWRRRATWDWYGRLCGGKGLG